MEAGGMVCQVQDLGIVSEILKEHWKRKEELVCDEDIQLLHLSQVNNVAGYRCAKDRKK